MARLLVLVCTAHLRMKPRIRRQVIGHLVYMCVCVYQRMDSKNSFPVPFLEWVIEYSLHVHWVELRVVDQ